MGKKSRNRGVRYRNRRDNGPEARRKMGIVFAVALGWCGVHRFTLGQWQWGLAHIFIFVASMAVFERLGMTPWTTISAFLAYYTAYKWWRMSDEEFAEKYLEPVEEEVGGKYLKGQTITQSKVLSSKTRRRLLTTAQQMFDDFDYQKASQLYEEALDMDLRDGDSRVLAARCYSLLEDADAAYRHLRKAILLKANNLELINQDEGFAWLRMHQDFKLRKRAGFGPVDKFVDSQHLRPELSSPQPNILDQLERLGDLKERGLLNDDEFLREKKRLLG